MSDNLKDFYQEIILEHSKSPRNFKEMQSPSCCGNGHNASCGDKLKVCLKLNEKKEVDDISFSGIGCAISLASASLMTEAILHKSFDEANKIFQNFHSMLTKECSFECKNMQEEKLKVFCSLKDYPSRVKCATLPWHAMIQAFEEKK